MAYTFNVSVILENPTDDKLVVSIPRGTIFEPSTTHLSFQRAVYLTGLHLPT